VPTYSYACTECDHRFDAVQAFTDDALTTCPQCSGRLRKLFNSVGVVFKGSGFYRNDSREAGGKTAKSEPSSSDKSAEKTAKPEKSTDATSSSSSTGSSTGSNSGGSSPSKSSAPAATSS
jgi:putative FmdB family regulatory protein